MSLSFRLERRLWLMIHIILTWTRMMITKPNTEYYYDVTVLLHLINRQVNTENREEQWYRIPRTRSIVTISYYVLDWACKCWWLFGRNTVNWRTELDFRGCRSMSQYGYYTSSSSSVSSSNTQNPVPTTSISFHGNEEDFEYDITGDNSKRSWNDIIEHDN